MLDTTRGWQLHSYCAKNVEIICKTEQIYFTQITVFINTAQNCILFTSLQVAGQRWKASCGGRYLPFVHCYTMLYHDIHCHSFYTLLYYVIPWYPLSFMLYTVILCYTMISTVIPCYTLLYYFEQCNTMLYNVKQLFITEYSLMFKRQAHTLSFHFSSIVWNSLLTNQLI